jgi:hypothetical protein
MTANAGPGELVRELRATLEAIGGGLVDGRPERLLDAEPRLAAIVARLAAHPLDVASVDRDALLQARAALRRCEELGATIFALNDVYATRHGYGPSGLLASPGCAGHLQARG